jgi:GT2 family glycosyltransferase
MADQVTLDREVFPYAQTANCAILRSAFVEVGGFAEEVRAAEDADLCFRLEAQGWQLERRPRAVVRHRTRATTVAALMQLARHGAGASWCDRRHPGSFPPPTPKKLLGRTGRAALAAARAAAHGDAERAAFAALDIAETLSFESGRLLTNRARR